MTLSTTRRTFIFLLYSFLVQLSSSILFNLQPRGKECFSVAAKSSTNVEEGGHGEVHIIYEVVAEGIPMIQFSATSMENQNVLKQSRDASLSWKMDNPETANLCFGSMSSKPQTVSLDVRYDAVAESATKSQADEAKTLAVQLEERVARILVQQEFAMTRDAVHRAIGESTSERVLWWTLAEVGALIVLTLIQMKYLRSFFENKHIV